MISLLPKLARKGVELHEKVLKDLFDGVDWKDGQKCVIFDLIPNRTGPETKDLYC